MENALNLMAILGPVFVVLGISMIVYVKPWLELIKECEKNHYSLICGALMGLILGLIMIRLYNVWEWNKYLLVTILGWLAFLKGVFYFLMPGKMIKTVIRWHESAPVITLHGVAALALGLYLSYVAYLV
ncbi:hypothetical protein HZA43_02265 [Candidatus Peregrinibacteria bacterium]|nr:hypothetical protein [Candidatus Peregrinibacteria bacterium]